MTSSHPTPCDSYREDLLVSLQGPDAQKAPEGEHVESCGECKGWTEGVLLQSGFLSSLDRMVAPIELETLLEEDLQLGASGQLGLLRGLDRQSAPAALDQLVATELAQMAQEEPAPAWTSLLEDLPRAQAPNVLERLVTEELAESEKAITKRFVGGLFRQRSPKSLDNRLKSELRSTGRPRLATGRSFAWGSAAAAALLVWIALPNFSATAKGPQLRLQVVEVAHIQDLSPFAGSLAAGLMGLDLSNMTPAQPTTDGGGL